MKKLGILLTFLLGPVYLKAQDVPLVKYDRLGSIIGQPGDEVRVINFWATWCKPCVKELPLFKNLAEGGHIEVHLVSLDYADNLDKVNQFVSTNNYKDLNVILLDEIDYNSWIDKVDSSWSGAIPATLIIHPKTGKRLFVEGEIKDGALERYIDQVSN
ncbi:TlpA family protein disulfide reductase [Fulvivirga sediminis]|uniref:TlpA family protein disulfide reductase n=1 Tax=Fulvivirga sediminis TaxID=2803949 RepID=A0A937JZY5_9BACT|nr:TlpA disulfide reductase family protein [Fulvivirga sediminis]MBL3657833.1 TlpA family protein disulfide reductase [Fulvivirga sediminis]